MPIGRVSAFLVIAMAASVPAAEVDKYLPNHSEFVLFVNVRQVIDSPLIKKYLLDQARSAFDSDGFKPRQIFQAMQLDPFKDITSLTLAGPGFPDFDKSLLVVRGKFDLNTIATVADTEAQRAPDTLKIHKQGDFAVYEFPSPRDRSVPWFLCFLDKQTAVLSPSRPAVTDAIAKKNGKRETTLSKEMQSLLDRVDSRRNLWLVGRASESLKNELGSTAQTKKLVGSLRNVSGGATIGEGLRANLMIEFGDPRVVGEVRKFLIGIQSLVELAVLGGEWSRKADDVLKKAVVISAEKDGVRIQIQASAAEIEKLLQAKPKVGE